MYLKRFIRRTLLSIVLPLLVMLVGYEWIYRAIPNAYKVKNAYLSHQAAAVETLILGSSHTFFGIDPSCFDRPAFNAANVSQDLEYDWFILSKYIRSLPALKQVILPISYFSLFGSLRTGEEDWRIRKYQIYMGAQDYPFYKLRYNFEFSQMGNREGLEHYLKGKDLCNCTSGGMGTSYRLANRAGDWEKTGEENAARHTLVDKLTSTELARMIQRNRSYLDSIFLICRQHDVQLLLITMPAWPTYYEHLDPQQSDKMHSIINQFTSVYGVDYIDMLKDQRFNKKDFFDADHLNEFGARKAAGIIQNYLKTGKHNVCKNH